MITATNFVAFIFGASTQFIVNARLYDKNISVDINIKT